MSSKNLAGSETAKSNATKVKHNIRVSSRTAKTEATADATKGLKRFLILDALATKLNVEVTNDDLSDQIRMAASQTGRDPEDIAKQLRESGRGNQVAMEIREAKAIETLLDQVLGGAEAAAKS